MTTVSGFKILACPGCGTRYRQPTYGSVFISDWEEWSDGRRRSPLYTPKPNTCVCPCGSLFLLSECVPVAHMTWAPPPQAPTRSRRSLWAVLRGEPALPPPKGATGRYDTEIFTGEPWPEYPEYPDVAPRPSVDTFAAVARDLPPGARPAVETALRRELWRLLNDAARPFKTPSEAKGDPAANSIWKPNLERLHTLLTQDSATERVEIGEVLRALGRFDEAITAFGEVEEDRTPLVSFLCELAALEISRVALIPDEVLKAMRPSITGVATRFP